MFVKLIYILYTGPTQYFGVYDVYSAEKNDIFVGLYVTILNA